MPTNGEHPSPRHKGGTPLRRRTVRSYLKRVERGNPNEVCTASAVGLTARKGTTLQWEQEDSRSEGRQAERQREFITGRIGQYLP